MKKKLIVGLCTFIVLILAICVILPKFIKADVDEHGVKKRYYTIGKCCEIYTDPITKNKEYKVNNNQYVFLYNLKEGDLIGMPNLHGCAQITIYANKKALVIHHTAITKPEEVEKLIQKYIKNFDKNDTVYVDFLFPARKEARQKIYEDLIFKNLNNYFYKKIHFHRSLFDRIQNNKSYLFCYRALITKDGLQSSIVVKNNMHVLRTGQFYAEKVKFDDRIKCHRLTDDSILLIYADGKLAMERINIKKSFDFKNLDIFKNNKPEVQLILPTGITKENSDRITNETKNFIYNRFGNDCIIKKNTYKNVKQTYYYDGRITKKGLKGGIKKYKKGDLYTLKK